MLKWRVTSLSLSLWFAETQRRAISTGHCACDNFQLLVAPVQRKFIVKQSRKMLPLDAAHDLAPFIQEMPSDLFFVLGALVLVQCNCNYDSSQTHPHKYNTCKMAIDHIAADPGVFFTARSGFILVGLLFTWIPLPATSNRAIYFQIEMVNILQLLYLFAIEVYWYFIKGVLLLTNSTFHT